MSVQSPIAQAILHLATLRGRHKTICPSEAARALWPEDWRPHMEEVRAEAFRLRDAVLVRILQRGEEVTNNQPTGPIRIAIV